MRAAIEAARQGVNVLLVDKGRLGRSSISSGDGGGSFGSIRIPTEMGGDPSVPEDAVLRDAVAGGEHLNRQDMTELFCKEAIDRFRDLEEWGVEFGKRPDGSYDARRNMGESYAYGFSLPTGPDAIFDSMLKELRKLGVTCLSNTMVTRLLTRQGRVAGAFGLDRNWGTELVFTAKSTVIAAGGMTGLLKHTSAYQPCSGDSFALAYEAGAQLFNMEICGFSLVPTPLGRSIPMGSTLPMTAGGARWYNALGERIMERYDPDRLELAAEWKMPYANYNERKEGRGPVYLDLSSMKGRGPVDRVVQRIKRFADVDPLHEMVEMSVSLRTSPGGVWINERGETTVPGLYAAGDASGEAGTRGAGGRTGGFPNAHVFGRRAGLYAAQAAQNMGLIEAEQDQIILEHARINGIKGSDGRSPIDVERKLREFAFENLNIIRNRQGLQRAIDYFQGMRQEGSRGMGATNPGQLIKALEVYHLAATGEMVARAGLLRTESRGFHHREDYPKRNDREWLQWVLIRKGSNGAMDLNIRPIPTDKYPIRPGG